MHLAEHSPTKLRRTSKYCSRPATAHRGSVCSRAGPKTTMEIKTVVVSGSGEDRMINPKTQHFMAEKRMGAKIHAHRVDDTPMYSEPDVVVNVILGGGARNRGIRTLPRNQI